MKRIIVIVVLAAAVAGAGFAQEADPIAEARADAMLDGGQYKATGWGFMAFGASILVSPLLGGGGVIIAANMIEPNVDVPPSRLAAAQRQFTDTSDLLLYQAQYQEAMAKPMQKQRSRRAWIGTGIGLGVNILLISLILSAY